MALAGARDAYDVIVLLPKTGWSYPDRENATAHVLLGEVDVFPAPTAGLHSRGSPKRRRACP
ncbi:hypothetical protein [Streptomyces solincola]|uniref:hypothetical protein n=1 Tax=Streptomyces solincola TaxID=2100817 RepID=UPI0015E46D90|nr:hypothetical protein [Streptomyces solincola]